MGKSSAAERPATGYQCLAVFKLYLILFACLGSHLKDNIKAIC